MRPNKREALGVHAKRLTHIRAAQQAGAPAPRANVWSAQRNSSPFLKLRPNGDPLFPVLNFPLQQFSFCLFQKKGRITFY